MDHPHRSVWLYLDRVVTVLILTTLSIVLWVAAPALVRMHGQSTSQVIEELRDVSMPLRSADPSAANKIALIEFSDFRCPFCKAYSLETSPQVHAQFVDTGRIVYEFRHSPLTRIHPDAFRMAQAADCASQHGRFVEMRPLLFNLSGPADDQRLKEMAEAAGVDSAFFTACMAGNSRENVERDLGQAAKLGIQSTPTLLIGRVSSDGARVDLRFKIRGAVPHAELTRLLEQS